MTKRFKIVHLREYHICDIQDTAQDILTFYTDVGVIESVKPVVDLLNELNDENEQLKTLLKNTSDQRDEFHRGARENANRVGKLEKENEQLKTVIGRYDFSVDIKNDEINNLHLDYLKLEKENEQLKQRINSRLHFYRELYDSTNDDIVKRVVEDLEDILKG